MFILLHFIFTFIFSVAAETEPANQNFTNYVNLFNQSGAKNVESLLAELKSANPEYFQSYLAGYRSRSLQNSSFEAPRIILFSTVADLAIAFNGDPSHRGYNNLETMAFNYETDRFEFYEGRFEDNHKPSLGTANPRKCLECHQSATRTDIDPRPNWEPYNKWPGFYGSLDDTVGGYFKDEKYLLSKYPDPEDRVLVDEVLREESEFTNFNINRATGENPRYALLDDILNKAYSNDVTVNTPYTKKLAILNLRRVARLMTQDKEVFDFAKWNIAASKRCSNLKISNEAIEYLIPRTTAPLTKYVGSKSSRLYFGDAVALMFEPFGIDTTDWSMDFKTGGKLAFQERFGTPNDTWIEFNQGFEKYFLSDPELNGADCKKINAEAEKRFGDIVAVKSFYEKRQAEFKPVAIKPLLDRCISCHVENAGVVPALPFDDEASLREALKKSGYKRGTLLSEIRHRLGSNATVTEQMPPAGIPTARQKTDLLNYLNSL